MTEAELRDDYVRVLRNATFRMPSRKSRAVTTPRATPVRAVVTSTMTCISASCPSLSKRRAEDLAAANHVHMGHLPRAAVCERVRTPALSCKAGHPQGRFVHTWPRPSVAFR